MSEPLTALNMQPHESHESPAICRAVLDEDTPAFGKNYCTTCSRYFVTPHALTTHSKSKDHKRRSACTSVSAIATWCRPPSLIDANTDLSMQLLFGCTAAHRAHLGHHKSTSEALLFKRRIKELQGDRPHRQGDADKAGNMGAPDNGPKLRSGGALPAAME